jgi:ubiquinone/menaquinone biosynthesis C-methylase UbiE
MKVWEEIGMGYFWGDLFDVRFFVINLIKNDNVEKILDLGCGIGMISHFSNSKLKIGLELQEKSIKNAKKLNPDMELIRGDIRFLPFKNNVFPKILSIHSLSSMSTPEQRKIAVSEINRVLNEKGEIIASAANLRSKHYSKKFTLSERLGYVNYKELVEVFKNEFNIRVEGFNPYPKWLTGVLRRIIMKLPENEKIDELIFKTLKSEKFLKNGRGFFMILKKKSEH